MVVIAIGGVKGVGKTTLLKNLESVLSNEPPTEVVYGSSKLNEIALKEYSKSLNELSSRQTEYVHSLFLDYIEKDRSSVTFVDMHYADVVDGKIKNLVSQRSGNMYDIHIFLDAPAEEILNRRINDKSRLRNLTISDIYTEINAEKTIAENTAREYNKKLCYFSNIEIKNAIDEIIKIVKMEFNIDLKYK